MCFLKFQHMAWVIKQINIFIRLIKLWEGKVNIFQSHLFLEIGLTHSRQAVMSASFCLLVFWWELEDKTTQEACRCEIKRVQSINNCVCMPEALAAMTVFSVLLFPSEGYNFLKNINAYFPFMENVSEYKK